MVVVVVVLNHRAQWRSMDVACCLVRSMHGCASGTRVAAVSRLAAARRAIWNIPVFYRPKAASPISTAASRPSAHSTASLTTRAAFTTFATLLPLLLLLLLLLRLLL